MAQTTADNHPILLFDGVCNLCNGVIKFAIKRDRNAHLHFASLQSEPAKVLMRQHGLDENQLKTFILIENGKAHTRSTAALRLARHFTGLWPMLYIFIIIPKPIRDAVYNFISKNRYRWFGKEESCMIPTPDISARFLA